MAIASARDALSQAWQGWPELPQIIYLLKQSDLIPNLHLLTLLYYFHVTYHI